MRRIRHGAQRPLGEDCSSSRGYTDQFWLGGPIVSAYRNVDSESNLHFLSSYRGGQLVVEYATVCFRSQEDCGPIAPDMEGSFQQTIRSTRYCWRLLCQWS